MSKPSPIPLIENLPTTIPFVGPEAIERRRGLAFAARIGANESGFGPSPRVIEAMQQEAPHVWQYGDPENHELNQSLASFHGLGYENISVGPGVDALLGLIVRQYILPGDRVVNSLGGYPTFNYHVTGFGGQLVHVPYRDYQADLPALIEVACQTRAKIIYLANPDNPLGSYHETQAVANFIAAVPEDITIVLDEAYGETAPCGSLLPFDIMPENLLRLRTFSKAYGLAGLRCGYVIGTVRAIASFEKIRDHFSINRIAQKAALVALEDKAYLQDVVKKIAASRVRIGKIAAANGLRALPSHTNFVAIDCGMDGDFAARLLLALEGEGIFIRKPSVQGLAHLVRVSTAPDTVLDIFEDVLPRALKATANAG